MRHTILAIFALFMMGCANTTVSDAEKIGSPIEFIFTEIYQISSDSIEIALEIDNQKEENKISFQTLNEQMGKVLRNYKITALDVDQFSYTKMVDDDQIIHSYQCVNPDNPLRALVYHELQDNVVSIQGERIISSPVADQIENIKMDAESICINNASKYFNDKKFESQFCAFPNKTK